ncbi:MAG: HIT domain-containing protein [Anaerolineaceae bacterium]|nr:HIT domain-containing protein [Anaerolineaceae bacterium]
MKQIWSPWRMEYIMDHSPMKDCIFCQAIHQADDTANLILFRGERAFVILNRYPYTSGHLMVVPYDHFASITQLETATRAEMMELLSKVEQVLGIEYHPDGFNLGANIGEVAGAGVLGHVHFHVVPRWAADANFMTSVAETRVLPEGLAQTYHRLKESWENFGAGE